MNDFIVGLEEYELLHTHIYYYWHCEEIFASRNLIIPCEPFKAFVDTWTHKPFIDRIDYFKKQIQLYEYGSLAIQTSWGSMLLWGKTEKRVEHLIAQQKARRLMKSWMKS
jgi:hypothetical protein